MSKRLMIIIAISAIIIMGCLIAWGVASNFDSKSQPNNNEIVYYYGEQCSHCKKVQAFLDENNVSDKIPYTKKEVFDSKSKENFIEWQQNAQKCGIKNDELGVPFVAADGKCYTGDIDVIDFFRKKIEE